MSNVQFIAIIAILIFLLILTAIVVFILVEMYNYLHWIANEQSAIEHWLCEIKDKSIKEE